MTDTLAPTISGTRKVIHATAALTLNREDSGALITNLGSSGAVVVSLPQDAKGGEVFEFVCMAAQDLRVAPGAAGGIYASNGTSYSKQTDNKYIEGAAIGESCLLIADGNGDWVALRQVNGGGATSALGTGFDAVEA